MRSSRRERGRGSILTEITDFIHGAFLHIVELLSRRATSEDAEHAFVGSAADAAVR